MSWTIALCLIPCLFSLIGAAIIYSKGRSGNTVQKLLASALLTLGVGMMYVCIFQIPTHQTFYWLDWLLCTDAMIVPPLFFLYICHLTGTSSPEARSFAFIPAVIVSLGNCILYLMMGDSVAQQYFQRVTTTGSLGADPSLLYVIKRIFGSYLYRAVILVPTVVFILMSINKVKEYHRNVEDFLANADEKYFRADNTILWTFVIFVIVAIVYSLFPYSTYKNNPLYLIIIAAVTGAAVSLITFYGIKQTYSAEDLEKMRHDNAETGIRNISRNELSERIYQLESGGFFYNPDITAASLADELGTTPDHVVELLKKEYSASFSGFVNEKRIKEAVVLMRNVPVSTPLTKIAIKVGYQAYPTFAKYFEMFMHVTPSEWMRKYR